MWSLGSSVNNTIRRHPTKENLQPLIPVSFPFWENGGLTVAELNQCRWVMFLFSWFLFQGTAWRPKGRRWGWWTVQCGTQIHLIEPQTEVTRTPNRCALLLLNLPQKDTRCSCESKTQNISPHSQTIPVLRSIHHRNREPVYRGWILDTGNATQNYKWKFPWNVTTQTFLESSFTHGNPHIPFFSLSNVFSNLYKVCKWKLRLKMYWLESLVVYIV